MEISLILILPIWLYSLYTGLIKKKNKVLEAFSAIDVQLKKRYELLPNILTIAQKFMEHERALMAEVTNLRINAVSLSDKYTDIDKKVKLNNQITSKMTEIFASFENYPQLKSDATMLEVMNTYKNIEEHISAARRFYNAAVLDLKNATETFPSSFIAKKLNIKATEFFNVSEEEKNNVRAKDYLNNK